MLALYGKRFVTVTGKGGVGKTTFCAAYAHALAAQGQNVLIAMCNAKEQLSAMFGSAPVGPEVSPVHPGVWAVNIEPEKALEEYGLLTLKSRAVYKLLFDNKYVRAFFKAVPGLAEWSMLGKAWWHTTEVGPDGRPKYDTVLLDAPATGHGLDMLRVPKVIVDVAPPGILRRDAELAWALFNDASRSGVVILTLPEELPVTETLELSRSIRGELGMPIAQVVVNGAIPTLFGDGERRALESADPQNAGPLYRTVLERALREAEQARLVEKLEESLNTKAEVLPLLFSPAANPAAIATLATLVR